jgi:hypothetical protein
LRGAANRFLRTPGRKKNLRKFGGFYEPNMEYSTANDYDPGGDMPADGDPLIQYLTYMAFGSAHSE